MRIIIAALGFVAISVYCVAQAPKDAPLSSARSDAAQEKKVKLDPQGEAHPPSVWMQQKLKQSHEIFAGMVEGDLSRVEDSVRRLKLINRLESFVRGRSKEYRTQMRVFQYANDEILKGAKEKNIDRVTLGYNQMTLSCVTCHKQLRKAE